MTNLGCLNSSSELENGFAPACRVDIDETYTTLDACNASSSQDEQNVTEIIKGYNNQASLLRNTNTSEWWGKQAESNLKHVANIVLAYQLLKPALKELFWVYDAF